MNVFWTNKAIEHLTAIHSYHAQVSPQYATRLVDLITKRSQQIATFPNSGRMLPEINLEQIREVIVVLNNLQRGFDSAQPSV
ncbi:type II toxin-antitoxin system RelE/ParE family toxin [Pseudanabaena yagii]|uniref:Type II toxin-antitoxin system RelE/ParE family toxin n=1 Tax=Pseudanabaena yagii GIHE-NHR1 TaxID=2722753 RepID=A0ABX1LSH1_9CYAN|nr:type II toxin-antitoxin system RelE/ParE family toxin [Pseudanabaena yagii]NMF58446.1 type II toxin-antitoxin system RelE/ParE family toxin [Pseudanabaena yagii GIHE-NHR1]